MPAGFGSSAEYCEHVLEEAGVVISPGGAYGPNGEGFFRISLTTPDDRLLEAVERLGKLAAADGDVRYCGIDVSGTRGHQQLCTLHERRGSEGVELVATFYAPGDVDAVARTVLGFGGEAVAAVDAPSGHRLDLLAPGQPLRAELGVPDGRFERHRVCDALLFRRRLPLYPVPAANQALAGWERWIGLGFELFAALGAARRVHARGGRRGAGPHRHRRAALRAPLRDVPRRRVLLDDRPPARRPSARRGGCRSASTRCARAPSSTPTAASGTARSTSSTPARPPTPPTCSPTAAARGSATRARASSSCPSRSCCARYDPLPPPARAPLA